MGELTAQNPKSIREMFGAISSKYDLANSVLSAGIHHLWKRKLIQKSEIQKNQSVLDCATGTGDLAFLFEKVLKGTGFVTGTDFCEPMLENAKIKAQKSHSKVRFEWADVTHLPYSSESFHVASISFGIRNVQNPQKGLSELGRVVKPGGKVLVLEFGQPRSKVISALYGFYSQVLLPIIGGWISGQPQAYRYLQTSSSTFPCGEDFLKMARDTGMFSKTSYLRFQSGIAYLYILERF